jgi:transcriptional regulator of nitric oxide reductase
VVFQLDPLASPSPSEVASACLLEDGFFDPAKPWFTRWGDLPHMRQDGALYFVTFRLADSLPQTLLSTWRHERDEWRRNNPAPSPRAAVFSDN